MLTGSGWSLGLVILFTTGCAGNSTTSTAEQVALGEQVYADNCATCHGTNGEGENPSAPLEPGADGLYPAPPHNSNGHTWHHADELLLDTIRKGRAYPGFKEMPGFGDTLTEEEIEAVLAYIKSLWAEEQRQIQAQASAPQQFSEIPTIREALGDD